MSIHRPITLTLDRRILEHPRAHHLRRMRVAIWLYLDLLARLPAGAGTIEVEPAAIGQDMGLPEGTVRSWLGHLRKSGYLKAERLNGSVRVTIKRDEPPTPAARSSTPKRRSLTVEQLVRALNAKGSEEAFRAVLETFSEDVIRRSLAGALAVPEDQIRRSRTALFLYLLNRHAQDRKKT